MNARDTWRSIIAAFVSIVATAAAIGATYYVDSVNGNDANTGTSTALAWRSLTKVNATTFAAGDAILFKAGGSWIGQLHPLGSGASGSSIVIDLYGTGAKPLINGNGVTGNGAVYLWNQQYWEVNNLEVVNDGTADADRRGVYFGANNFGTVNHLYLKNCNIHNIRGLPGTDTSLAAKRTGGIVVECTGDATTATRFNDILIDSNTVTTCRNQGIVAAINGDGGNTLSNDEPYSTAWLARKATNLVIRNNTVSDIMKNAMIIRYCDASCLIERNVCFNTATGTTGNTMFTAACGGVVFQFNEGYANHAGDHDGSLYDADLRSRDIVFQYSYSHENSHGLFWHYANSSSDTGQIIRYNISQNDQGDIFALSGGGGTEFIYNNTVYIGSGNPSPTNPPQKIFDDRTSGHTYTVKNNIFYVLNSTATYNFTSGNTRTFDYNIFYGVHPATEPGDAHKLTNDPLLVAPGTGGTGISTVNGYQLQAGSPALGSGVLIANNGGLDFWGNPVSSSAAPNRGAYNGNPGGGGQVAAPTFNPVAGTYSSAQNVTISTTTSGASIRYTVDGSTPTSTTGTLYSAPVNIGSTTTLKAIAYASGMTDSTVTSGLYTINLSQVAAPTFNPAAGTYSSAQSVTISTTTSGASIRYTVDGSTPTSTTGTLYSAPVNIAATTTLKAIAYASGMADSTVTSGTYTITSTGLPAPWVTVDVGAVGIAGSASASNGVFTVKGSGASLNGSSPDEFRYVYQTLSGDGSITARVTSQDGSGTKAYAGVMIRETTAADSTYMFMARERGSNMRARSRVRTGGATTSSTSAELIPPNCWVRITRTGNSLVAAQSSNGTSWTTIKTVSITMAANVTMGIIVTSGSNTVLDTDAFDNVTAVP